MTKSEIINEIIRVEGGYVNDPSDSGGETKYGITKKVALANNYHGDIKKLTKDKAFSIYEEIYWNSLQLDMVSRLSESIANEIMDTGVNMGVSRAGKFLQRALTALNSNDEYISLVVDGDIGDKTIQALTAFLGKRGENGKVVLYNMLNCLQGSFYIELTECRKKDKKFIYGWFRNRIETK